MRKKKMDFASLNSTSIEKLKQEIVSLKMLKSALGFRRQENITKQELLNYCIEHNKNEIYLLIYIIDCIHGMPASIKKQSGMLIKNMDDKEVYKKLLAETENLYLIDEVFLRQKKKIKTDLELQLPSSRYYFNQIIYEFSRKYLNETVCLNEKNVLLNLHLMQRWLYEQDYKCIKLLTHDEIDLFCTYLQDGYTDNAPDSENTAARIREKLGTETISQALGKFYFNMLLTEMGALPSKLSAKYVNVDNRIYDILNKSIEKLAMDNNLQLDRGHFGSNGHFSGYYDEQYDNVMEYTNAFAEFLKSRYPEQSNIIAPYIFESNVKNVTPNQIKYSAARIHELINNIGVEELINTINDFNAIMHLKEKENYSNYLDKQSKITPEMSEVFKKTTKLVDYYFDHRDQMNIDTETLKNVDKYILVFLHSKDLNEQYEAACQLKTFIEQRMLDDNIINQDTNEYQK